MQIISPNIIQQHIIKASARFTFMIQPIPIAITTLSDVLQEEREDDENTDEWAVSNEHPASQGQSDSG